MFVSRYPGITTGTDGDAGSYELIIGAATNTKTILRRSIGGATVKEENTQDVLGCGYGRCVYTCSLEYYPQG